MYHLIHVYGRKHVRENRFHQLNLASIGAEIAESRERSIGEKFFIGHLLLERRNYVSSQRIIVNAEHESGSLGQTCNSQVGSDFRLREYNHVRDFEGTRYRNEVFQSVFLQHLQKKHSKECM